MLQNNRQATEINTLIGALSIARSEAIKRGFNVILCRSTDGATCANNGGWQQGWIIFVDADNNNAPQAAEIIRVFGALSGRSTLIPNNNFTNMVIYQPNGFSSQVGTFVHCDDRDGDGDVLDGDDFTLGGAVIINRTGRARTDTAPNTGFANCEG
ncbi:MAG: GspH/FimT family protein [Gammaproteobacteria bacterium]|nr:GspH/FimT family protein [Gammaproteobacteria bacterium]